MDINAAYMYCFQPLDTATNLQHAQKAVTELSQDNIVKSHQIVNLTKDLESMQALNRELNHKLNEIQAMLDQQIKKNVHERVNFEEKISEMAKQLDDAKIQTAGIEKSKNLFKDQLIVQNQLLADLTEENKIMKNIKINTVAYNTIQRSITPNQRPFLLQRPLDAIKINQLSVSISCEQASLIAKEMKHQLSILRHDIQEMKKLFCKSMQDIRVIVDVNKEKIIPQRSVVKEQCKLGCNTNLMNGKIPHAKQQLVDEFCQNMTSIVNAMMLDVKEYFS